MSREEREHLPAPTRAREAPRDVHEAERIARRLLESAAEAMECIGQPDAAAELLRYDPAQIKQ